MPKFDDNGRELNAEGNPRIRVDASRYPDGRAWVRVTDGKEWVSVTLFPEEVEELISKLQG